MIKKVMNQPLENYKETKTKSGTIMYFDTHAHDRNSCAVAALVACFNIDIDHATSFARDFWGRKHGKGTRTAAVVGTMRDGTVGQVFNRKITPTGQLITKYRCYGRTVLRTMTLKTFLKKHPTGTYYLLISRHALCVRDGVMYDSNINSNLRKRCVEAFKID